MRRDDSRRCLWHNVIKSPFQPRCISDNNRSLWNLKIRPVRQFQIGNPFDKHCSGNPSGQPENPGYQSSWLDGHKHPTSPVQQAFPVE